MKPTLLIISQTYVPDPAAVGQYMHHAAVEMARRGYRVRVLASARGYEQPDQRYPSFEVVDGVEIRRLPFASFGKASIAIRLLGGFVFVLQALLLGVWTRRLGAVLVSTSPPMACLAAQSICLLRRVPMTFWAMDINPDQMIAMGMTRAGSLPARLFDAMIRSALRQAKRVVVLDTYMAATLHRKVDLGDKVTVIAPWPMDDQVRPVDRSDNAFGREQGFGDKRVVMYSGNISPSHPVTPLLEAARRLRDCPQLLFVFVGGGLARESIDRFVAEHGLGNVRTLPYQPLEKLSQSLGAADVHVVVMGKAMVGIVHPCKVYNAMAAARPVLLIGPSACHVGDLLSQASIGWQADAEDVASLVAVLYQIAEAPPEALTAMGQAARGMIDQTLSEKILRSQFCDLLAAQMSR